MPTRVFIVGDSLTKAEALRALLEEAGYTVGAATTGEDALRQLEAQEYDVVVSDVVMPGSIDGYELCRRLKASSRPDTPLMLLTNLSDPLHLIRGLECGADQFLAKPYAPDDLLARVRSLLATRAARGKSRPGAEVPVLFMGREFTITAEREQILSLLMSTFEEAVRQNRELKLREEALHEINKEFEAFNYSISHDLRAPLRHADAFSRILLEEYAPQLDDTAQRYVGRVRDAVGRMEIMVNALLNLGRVGRREPRLKPTALRSVVDAAIGELEGQTRDRKVEWRVGPLPEVECDAELIDSVISNLLSNAVKYSRGKDDTVIEVGQTQVGGDTAIFVRDNGVGFDMRYSQKLFGVFQRLHAAEEFEGTGIGLATAQRVVHKHGGRIWAEAEVGKGATFFFTLAGLNPATPRTSMEARA